MEISKMLTISIAHIKESTANFLNNEQREHLIVYPKLDFGWFIYLDANNISSELSLIPDDLSRVIRYALDYDIDVLCLDRDAEIETVHLPVYDW